MRTRIIPGGRLLYEWIVVAASIIIIAFLLNAGPWSAQFDKTLCDAGLTLFKRPPSKDIVIVSIDDDSLQRMGSWPWNHATIAALLDRISSAHPRAVGIDLALVAPEINNPAADTALLRAVENTHGAVLPALIAGGHEVLPFPVLRSSVLLSHVNLDADSDGILRTVSLLRSGHFAARPHMALALLYASGYTKPFHEYADPTVIAFAGPAGHFPMVSAGSVLQGKIDSGTFNGKYVLLGITAAGLGEGFITPSSTGGKEMAGIEITANVLDSLLAGIRIAPVGFFQQGVISATVLLSLLIAFPFLGHRGSLLLSIGTVVVAFLFAYMLLAATGIWLGPTSTIISALIAYPLWSWRRLETVSRYLDKEIDRLETEGLSMPFSTGRHSVSVLDHIERRIATIRTAITNLRDARRFVSDSLDGLPYAVIVADQNEQVVIANHRADNMFGLDSLKEKACRLEDVLAQLQPHGETSWLQSIAMTKAGNNVTVSAAIDYREFNVTIARFHNGIGEPAGLMLVLDDVTALRKAQLERDEALTFLSHDLRSPQSSIMALVELQRNEGTRKIEENFIDDVERLATTTLTLADEFIQVARADSKPLKIEVLELNMLVEGCIAEIEPQTAQKKIRLACQYTDEPLSLKADRSLVSRAIVNLLSNAVKYSPPGSTVGVTTGRRSGYLCCTVQDRGVGISEADQARLFRRFERLDIAARVTGTKGAGLGLALVGIVVRRHGGRIEVDSQLGKGSSFSIWLAEVT